MSIWDKGLITVFVLILLSLCYRNGYLEGRASVYREQMALPTDGTCFVKGGCDNDSSTNAPKRHTR